MGEEERYRKLGLEEALHRPQDYYYACKELSFLLRRAYSKLPKALQSLLFHEALTAFRLLPLQGISGTTSANGLFQASEAVFPRQRKVVAASEFKRAVVAQKRRLKGPPRDEEGLWLPDDMLMHVFSFLDVRSLAISSLVCRLWKSVSSSKTLWRSQYLLFFGEDKNEHHNMLDDNKGIVIGQINDEATLADSFDWRQAFARRLIGKSFASGRAFCRDCKALIWLSCLTCSSPHHCMADARVPKNIKPLSPLKLAKYLLGEILPCAITSDGDSDSDETSILEMLPKFWAYPIYIGNAGELF